MKVVILTSDWYLSPKIAIKKFLENSLLKKYNIQVVGIISASNFKFNKRTYKTIHNFIKKSGLIFFIKNACVHIWQTIIVKFARFFIPNVNRNYFDIKELATIHSIPYIHVSDINKKTSEKFLKKLKPDYLVSCLLLQIVKKNILKIPKKGSINFHPALTQKHRGIFSSFWVLVKNWKRAGATVHFMTEKIDDGKIIIQKRFFIHKSDTVNSINEKTAILGGDLLVRALIKLKRKKTKGFILKNLGQLFSTPSGAALKKFKKRGRLIIRLKDFFKI